MDNNIQPVYFMRICTFKWDNVYEYILKTIKYYKNISDQITFKYV